MRIYDGVYINNKNKEFYIVIHVALNCDNSAQPETFRISYKKLKNDEKIYNRDEKEFLEKFTKINILKPVEINK